MKTKKTLFGWLAVLTLVTMLAPMASLAQDMIPEQESGEG